MADLRITYASFKSLMGNLLVYYATGTDGSYKLFCFPPAGDCNYSVISDASDISDFNTNIKPSAISVINQIHARALNNMPPAATTVNIPQNASSTTLSAANADRKSLIIWNAAAIPGTTLYIKHGTGASSSSYTVAIDQGVGYELPLSGSPPSVYPGIVTGVWSIAGGGAARVTEG